MKNEKFNSGTKISYLLIGGSIGAVLALLFAPKAGQEFRADIADVTRKGLDKTRETAGQLGEKAQTVYQDTKTKVGEIYESTANKAGELYDSATKTLSSTTDAVKKTAEDTKNAVEEKVEQTGSAIEAGKKEFNKTMSQRTS
jgi:gas vesicle protein